MYNRVYDDVNKIATVFGKDEFREFIKNQIQHGNLVRVKIKNIQTSESTSPINADYSKDVSDDIVSQPQQVVKGDGKKTSEEMKQSRCDADYLAADESGDGA